MSAPANSNIIRSSDSGTIGTVLVATEIVKRVATVYRPKKAFVKVVEVITEIATFLVAVVTGRGLEVEVFVEAVVIGRGFVVPDLCWLRSRLCRPLRFCLPVRFPPLSTGVAHHLLAHLEDTCQSVFVLRCRPIRRYISGGCGALTEHPYVIS